MDVIKTKQQVNVDFTKFPELLDDLDQMVDEDGTDRSKLIRKLIRQEKARRGQPQFPAGSQDSKKRKNAVTREVNQLMGQLEKLDRMAA